MMGGGQRADNHTQLLHGLQGICEMALQLISSPKKDADQQKRPNNAICTLAQSRET